jgi:hypothetical protein
MSEQGPYQQAAHAGETACFADFSGFDTDRPQAFHPILG